MGMFVAAAFAASVKVKPPIGRRMSILLATSSAKSGAERAGSPPVARTKTTTCSGSRKPSVCNPIEH